MKFVLQNCSFLSKNLKQILQIIAIFVFCFCNFANKIFAQEIRIISDAETESFLAEISYPIINAANLNHKEIKFYLVDDNNINAFVTNGQNIFINLGLITNFPKIEVLMGVIAHEIGHIAGGHLAKASEDYQNNQKIATAGYLMGTQ